MIILERLRSKIITKSSGQKRKRFKSKEPSCELLVILVCAKHNTRLQSFIEYKAKELNIPFTKINPHAAVFLWTLSVHKKQAATSQECSYCGVIGTREKETFICNNSASPQRCCKHGVKRNSDINAALRLRRISGNEASKSSPLANRRKSWMFAAGETK